MQIETERIDQIINNLQADRSPMSSLEPLHRSEAVAEEIALIKTASMLNALGPGSMRPTPDFLSGLRQRVLTEAGSAAS